MMPSTAFSGARHFNAVAARAASPGRRIAASSALGRGRRMREAQPGAVQELALETGPTRAAVVAVTGDRMPDGGEVGPDLVRAPGLQAGADQRQPGQLTLDARSGCAPLAASRYGSTCACAGARHGPAEPRSCRSRSRASPSRARGTRVRLAPPQRLPKPPLRLLALGDHHQPGRVAVEPVHDVGRPAATCSVLEQLDQGPATVARRRVHDEARRLVDDQQPVVLEHDARVRIGRLGGGRRRLCSSRR